MTICRGGDLPLLDEWQQDTSNFRSDLSYVGRFTFRKRWLDDAFPRQEELGALVPET